MTSEGDHNVMALLSYYRSKVADIEKEREDMVKRMGSTEASHADLHRARWELRVRQEEITELQNALSDANVHLFREREEALKLLAENDELKVQEIENRRRIQHLLSLTDPVAQEVTFFKDCRPMLMSRKLASSAGAKSSSNGPVKILKNDKLQVEHQAGTSSKTSQGAILRTIYLPNEQTETLNMRLQSVQRQLEEQKKISEDRINALELDRKEREDVHKKAIHGLNKQIEALEQKLELSEKATRASTKDYLSLRQETQIGERKLMENMATIQAENDKLKSQVEMMVNKIEKETDAIRASVVETSEKKMREFKHQVIAKKGKYMTLLADYEKIKADTESEMANLKKQNADLRRKCTNLEKRRHLDFEGFQNDVNEMRKQIRGLEVVTYGNVVNAENFQNEQNVIEPTVTLKSTKNVYSNKASMLQHELDNLRHHIAKLEAQQNSTLGGVESLSEDSLTK